MYGSSYFTTVAMWSGLPALLLGLVWVGRAWRTPEAWALLALGAVSFMAVFAIAPVSWVVDNVPPWSHVTIADRGLFAIVLPAAVAAGAGFTAVSRRPVSPRTAGLLGGAVLAAAVAGLALVRAGGHLTAPGGAQRHALVLAALWIVAGSALLVAIGRIPAGAAVAAAARRSSRPAWAACRTSTRSCRRARHTPARRRRSRSCSASPGPSTSA